MSQFLQMLSDDQKDIALLRCALAVRSGASDTNIYSVYPSSFQDIPTAPFAYWANSSALASFSKFPALGSDGAEAKQGLATADDFRFVRLWWECNSGDGRWCNYAKGGAYSPFYSDIYLTVNWGREGGELTEFSGSVVRNSNFYFLPGLTWTRRTSSGLSMRVMPANCIFGDKGPAIFSSCDEQSDLLVMLGLSSSSQFKYLVGLQLAAADAAARSYEVGVLRRTPLATLNEEQKSRLRELVGSAYLMQRGADVSDETSHAFLFPSLVKRKMGIACSSDSKGGLQSILEEIDEIASEAYGFAISESSQDLSIEDEVADERLESAEYELLSWGLGVAFGRFDWRLGTGERELPSAPEPFDQLPAKSPGMLPDGDSPFHPHAGVLVDDPGHQHDLPQLIEAVLERVDQQAPDNSRRWLQKDFFKEHLKQYSKSRRKAPIYWPLATASGGYTLWIYYPDLDDQTLYTAINDFLEPKLKLVGNELNSLRAKSNRSAAEERELEEQQDLEQELIELRDTILEIAPNYKPNHDDGVQITAAPLWPLFRHKPWQKVLKATWDKLEAGEYDWAHLAYSYCPERVREKCKTDKSLAIAHGLEDLYKEPAA